MVGCSQTQLGRERGFSPLLSEKSPSCTGTHQKWGKFHVLEMQRVSCDHAHIMVPWDSSGRTSQSERTVPQR